MLPLRHATGWRIAGSLLLVVILVAALVPTAWLFQSKGELIRWLGPIDKWLHGFAFVFLAVWFAGQYRQDAYWRIGAGLLLFGVLIEGGQLLVAYRSADWGDVAADAAGIIVGLTIAAAGLGGWSLRVEDWYRRRTAGPDID